MSLSPLMFPDFAANDKRRLDRTHRVVLKYNVLKNHIGFQRGAWKINTAQSLVILIAIVCVGVVYNAYRKAHEPDAPLPLTSPTSDPRYAVYSTGMKTWTTDYAKKGLVVTWPYLGLDQVARVDLPKVQPNTASWDSQSEANAAKQSYNDFVAVRTKAHIANPAGCTVHVFSPDGEIIASATGVSSADLD